MTMRAGDYVIQPGGAAGRPDSVLSVSALTSRIKLLLESEIPAGWVRGEVSNLRQQASGHIYFSLKDAESQIACVMFRGDAVRSGAGATLRDGAQVVVHASISVYEPRGNYQLIVRAALEDGVGRLQEEFERLKRRLAAEGLFDPERKRLLPRMPDTIGFITSPTGAALQDFIRILKRRNWVGRLVVLPVRVQGSEAAQEMAAAVALAQRLAESESGPRFDLLVIGRGGGSLEDLWAFNDEALVRAVASSRVPIISAVGHEIDFTLCDFAADVRAETPSAAAEHITSGFVDCCERARQAGAAFDRAVADRMRDVLSHVELLRRRLAAASPAARIERSHLRLDDYANRLAAAVRHSLQELRSRMHEAAGRLKVCSPQPVLVRSADRLRAAATRFEREFSVAIEARRGRRSAIEARLRAVDPKAVLRRGYVMIEGDDGRPVVSRHALAPGNRVRGRFHDGEVPMRVE